MLRTVLTLLSSVVFLHVAAAEQGMRASTVVYDAGRLDSAGNEPVLSSSFSLFHNGRVYDYVEAAGEVVVFDRAARKFTIINNSEGVFTHVTFDEVNHMLRARGPKTEEYVQELKTQKSPEADRAARTLAFQLNPNFENQFERKSGMLTLRAPSWKYTVSTREWENTDQLKNYIEYTDWTARLNYVLHPSSMFPEPRLALNEQLRQLKDRIPVVVQLDLRPDVRLILRAEHQFVRNLDDRDRQLINSWNDALKGTELKQVPFRTYQKAVLVSQRR